MILDSTLYNSPTSQLLPVGIVDITKPVADGAGGCAKCLGVSVQSKWQALHLALPVALQLFGIRTNLWALPDKATVFLQMPVL